MIRLTALALAALSLAACGASVGSDGGATDFVPLDDLQPSDNAGSQDTERFGILMNDERGAVSVQPVTHNQTLSEVAQGHATDMYQNDFFSHTGSVGSTIGTRVAASGYQYDWVAENILMGTTDEAAAVQEWMNSPPHREAMLNPRAQEFGLGLDGDRYVLVLADPAGP